ncbi:hypothetical protein [Roseococcus pinisoli]|uniref:Uncharacterized protein n=1 Tax=Roseococcus pinisoli TaxID=2835040 RepID=A0ABS5QFB6_9PROT|nr:hypothetical protein [Roseococcus pinisoli]MBS7812386.1 hypothetical protein [Roseococcus pinisoli]
MTDLDAIKLLLKLARHHDLQIPNDMSEFAVVDAYLLIEKMVERVEKADPQEQAFNALESNGTFAILYLTRAEIEEANASGAPLPDNAVLASWIGEAVHYDDAVTLRDTVLSSINNLSKDYVEKI